jgi:hypothetical protein
MNGFFVGSHDSAF